VLNLLDAAVSNPWDTLRTVVGDPLHPGGEAATRALLDRAGVDDETRLLDVGCGAGGSLAVARDRGATAVGLDREPRGPGTVRGDLRRLPFRDGRFDVALAECVLCLADVDRGLTEARRVLRPGGRLALSDVVVDGDLPEVPPRAAEALCLAGSRDRAGLLARIERAGFAVDAVDDRREDLLAMRDRAAERVDYEGLLGAFGARGQRLLAAIDALDRAVDDGRIGYVAVVATAD
jgi:SAM-dependent methyltransferase